MNIQMHLTLLFRRGFFVSSQENILRDLSFLWRTGEAAKKSKQDFILMGTAQCVFVILYAFLEHKYFTALYCLCQKPYLEYCNVQREP